MLCLTGFVVDATENSKGGGVAAEVCSSQTSLLFCTLPRDDSARTTKHIPRKRGNPLEVRSRDGHVEHMRAKYQDLSLKNGVDIWTLVRKACVFYAVACNYLVLV